MEETDKKFRVDAKHWIVIDTGVISWEGTAFKIISDFKGHPYFYVYHDDYPLGLCLSLPEAKKQCYRIAGDMVAMGVDP
jgi:hypothetical protein